MTNDTDLSDYEKNLIIFLRLFQNRPFHLAKYLLENDCLNYEFKEHLKNSKKLTNLSKDNQFMELPAVYFLNFKEMLKFFESLSKDLDFGGSDEDEIFDKLNSRLDELIKLEKYEDAIRIRDYMMKNNIKRKY
jgi:hypothetical protein